MPDNPHHRSLIWAVFWIVSGIIAMQLIYPPARAVPTATINGQSEGWQHEVDLAAQITQLFDATSVEVALGDQAIAVPLASLGAEPQTAAMVAELTEYPFWQRYLPLSVFLQQATLESATVEYTNVVMQAQCHELAQELSYPATNATLDIRDGQLIATDDAPGRTVDGKALCQRIGATTIALGQTTTLAAPSSEVAPERTSADFAAVRAQAEAILARDVTLTYEEQRFIPSREERAGWLQIDQAAGGESILTLQRSAVKTYLKTINEDIGRAPGVTNVRVVNGVEVSRDTGTPGREIAYSAVIDRLQTMLDSDVSEFAVTLRDVPATITYNSRYTATEAGLAAYVNDAARDYNAQIMVRQLDGPGWEVGARQYESIPSASTYKLYVAMWLFDQMEQGKLDWNSPILGTTVSQCFDRMTIASTNACAREWLSQYGRENMNRYVRQRGFSAGTDFNSPIAVHTTAADLTNYMTRLERGELYGDQYRQRLYASLSSHPYRYAVPTGSSATEVYDKVGFLWDYTHDTAVVRHPRGTYVVTIMTKGQSYARIASITREIERIMYP